MRIGILGDIHSNLEALRAVVRSMRADAVEHWVQVGDIVGYGPDPRACLDLVQELGCTVCMGNHDAAVLGSLPVDYFNTYARIAIEWTRHELRPADFEYLRRLEYVVVREAYTLTHGTLNEPEQFGYVLTKVEAQESMSLQRTLMGFVGHSHVPAIYLQRPEHKNGELDVLYMSEMEATVEGCSKILMNVGSVGQPRDEDPRAAYALYDADTGRMCVRRVEYDIAAVQRKIVAAGLPDVLAKRLALGV
jgi:predicted phosphodiesterase